MIKIIRRLLLIKMVSRCHWKKQGPKCITIMEIIFLQAKLQIINGMQIILN